MTNNYKQSRLGAVLILILFIFALQFDTRAPDNIQTSLKAVQPTFIPIRYEFTETVKYRTVEPPTLMVKKKPVVKKKVVARKYFTTEITAYCPCRTCTGNWNKKMKVGEVAASRSLPFGTRLRIGTKTYTVRDRLSKKYDHRVDIYFKTHSEALKFGKRIMKVEILK